VKSPISLKPRPGCAATVFEPISLTAKKFIDSETALKSCRKREDGLSEKILQLLLTSLSGRGLIVAAFRFPDGHHSLFDAVGAPRNVGEER
jgi:hypothetical protein